MQMYYSYVQNNSWPHSSPSLYKYMYVFYFVFQFHVPSTRITFDNTIFKHASISCQQQKWKCLKMETFENASWLKQKLFLMFSSSIHTSTLQKLKLLNMISSKKFFENTNFWKCICVGSKNQNFGKQDVMRFELFLPSSLKRT